MQIHDQQVCFRAGNRGTLLESGDLPALGSQKTSANPESQVCLRLKLRERLAITGFSDKELSKLLDDYQ